MKVGDIITIKNAAGLLDIRIEKELSMRDVAMGLGDDKVQILHRPRFEYHRGGYGEHLVTLCGNLDSTPFNIYLMHIRDYDNQPVCYLGVCDDTERPTFETVY